MEKRDRPPVCGKQVRRRERKGWPDEVGRKS